MMVTVSCDGMDIGVVSVVITGWGTGDDAGRAPLAVDAVSVDGASVVGASVVGASVVGASAVGASVVGATSGLVAGSVGPVVVGDDDATLGAGTSVVDGAATAAARVVVGVVVGADVAVGCEAV